MCGPNYSLNHLYTMADNVQMEYYEDAAYEYGGEEEPEEEEFLAGMGSDQYRPAPSPAALKDAEREAKAAAREMRATMLEAQRDARQRMREAKADQKERAAEAKRAAKRGAKGEPEADDGLFSDTGSPILGKSKIILLKKVQQYKSLFPAELKAFKIKKNPSEKDLADALAEMEVLVETSGVDDFMMDGVLQSIKLVEGASSYTTSCDIRGCADLLKANKQFHSLCKQLFIKYNVFSAVPAEYQLLMLVSTTAYVCAGKNKNRAAINAYLNEPLAG